MNHGFGYHEQLYSVHRQGWHSANDHQSHAMSMPPMPCLDASSKPLSHQLLDHEGLSRQQAGWQGMATNMQRNSWQARSHDSYNDHHRMLGGERSERFPIGFMDSAGFSNTGMFNSAAANSEHQAIHGHHRMLGGERSERFPKGFMDSAGFSNTGMFNNAAANSEHQAIHEVSVPAAAKRMQMWGFERGGGSAASWGDSGRQSQMYDENFNQTQNRGREVMWAMKAWGN